jgi:GcvH upstream region-like protein
VGKEVFDKIVHHKGFPFRGSWKLDDNLEILIVIQLLRFKSGDFTPMLDFFRRYQRYFFLVITVVIIISFSFFGTYSTLGSNTWREQIAFKAVNGREVTRSDVDELALFLATDNEDKMLYGGMWGPNFLNDGVIRKDFLETGLGQELVLAYQSDLQADIDKRLIKEKKYTLYSHPQARFLSVENVWNHFIPEMNTYFETLRTAENGLDADAFNSRVKLYLTEKKLPASTLRYVLRYQEKQYNWLKPDEKLNQADFSLFGYHTLEDWFGPHFTRLISEFIINAAILAEDRGYEVSKAEVLADIVRNTQLSYQQNLNNPNLGVTSSEEYLNEQLRRLNMDQARAIKIWRQVLLFRRYFHDAGATVLVDNMAHQNLQEFAHKNVTLDLYRLPSSLRLANYDDLQKFEVYVQAVAEPDKSDPLALPQQFLAVAEVANAYPELTQKRYELEVAQVSQKKLQSRIGLRELWNWEVENQNWQILAKQFPILSAKTADTREERFEVLDGLDSTTHNLVDTFAKQSIIKTHPEWIDQALTEAKSEKMIVGLRTQGGKMPFSGLDQKDKRQAFIQLLDHASLGEKPAQDSPLYHFSADQQTYYRIIVLDRAAKSEILTFAEARSDGTLDDIRDRILEKHYSAIREQNPSLYQRENKEWKSFKTVRDSVANQYFERTLLALESVQQTLFPDLDKKFSSKDQASSLRFYPYLNKVKEDLEKNSTQADQWIKTQAAAEKNQPASLSQLPTLADQWKIEKNTLTIDRQNQEGSVDVAEALVLNVDAWSTLKTPPNGDLAFYQVKNHGMTTHQPANIAQQTREAQSSLGNEAQRHLMQLVLKELKSKNALSLAYLQIPSDTPEEGPETIE